MPQIIWLGSWRLKMIGKIKHQQLELEQPERQQAFSQVLNCKQHKTKWQSNLKTGRDLKDKLTKYKTPLLAMCSKIILLQKWQPQIIDTTSGNYSKRTHFCSYMLNPRFMPNRNTPSAKPKNTKSPQKPLHKCTAPNYQQRNFSCNTWHYVRGMCTNPVNPPKLQSQFWHAKKKM